jgi:N-formylglutamate amidohydrolase
MNEAPFELVEPRSRETPVVVEVPHASIRIDPRSMALCVAPAQAIVADADLYVDELMADAPVEGATLLCARWSRYVLDLNRDEKDVDERAAVDGNEVNRPYGLVWLLTTQGQPALSRPMQADELERRLSWVHRPYHEALRAVVERKRQRFGRAVLLSAHSMPSQGVPADIVTGTQGRTTAAAGLIDLVERQAKSFGWTVSGDDPYPGGATTRRWGRPAAGIHAIQLELARHLYMDEVTMQKYRDNFAIARSFCRGLVAKLGHAALG